MALIFIKIGLKLSYLCQKKFFFECWWIRPPHPMPPVAGGLAPRPQLPPVVGGSAPRPRNASPHRRFLATRLHEEKFTARYCRPPFVLAFGFKYTWKFGEEDVLIHKRCIIRPKVFHLIILIQKNYLKNPFICTNPTLALAAMRFFLSEHCTLF